MSLRNALIDPTLLAPETPLRLTPVAPVYAHYRVLTLALRWLIAAVLPWATLTEAATIEPLLLFWPVAWTLLALTHLAWAFREARGRAWGLRHHDLLYASGLIQRRLTVVPCNRIQHVETASGPLERRFGLLRITCFTAGGLSADLVIRGLARGDAERVRQYLLGRIHELGAEADPDSDQQREQDPEPDPAPSS